MQQIMLLAEPLNATQVVAGRSAYTHSKPHPAYATQVVAGGSNVDSGPWGQAGVPYGAPMIANEVRVQRGSCRAVLLYV